MEKQRHYPEAEVISFKSKLMCQDCYLQALEKEEMVSADLFCIYADFLLEFGYFEDAEQVYEASYKTNCTDAIILNNYACFLLLIKEDVTRAEEMLLKSFQFEAGHVNVKNLILLYTHVIVVPEKAMFYQVTLEEMDNEGYYSSFESTQQNEV